MGSDNSTDSEDNISKKDLLKKLHKLEKKMHKTKRRHKDRSRSRQHRSRSRRSSGSSQRSRSRNAQRHERSPVRPHRQHAEENRRSFERRGYRSPRGSESRNVSVDRTSQGSADHLSLDDHSLRDVASIENASVTNSTQNEPNATISPELQLHTDEELPDNIIKILGTDPNQTGSTVFQIHPALSSRWSHLLSNGLSKEEEELLLNKYVLPSNCEALSPAEINPEIVTILSNPHIKRDKNLQDQQNQLSKGLVALSKGMQMILTDNTGISKELKENLLEYLSDSGKILTDLNYKISLARRNLITPSLSKNIKDTVEKTKPITFLFGSNLGEKVKDVKIMERTSKDLQAAQAPPSRPYPRSAHTMYNNNRKKMGVDNTRYSASRLLNRRRPARRQRETMRPPKGQLPNSDLQYRRRR